MLAFAFPGLNGLMRLSDRRRFLELREVQDRLLRADKVVEKHFSELPKPSHLVRCSQSEIYKIENVSLAAVIICSIQTGVFDALTNRGLKPDWLIGCSLGDLARTVCSGSYDFDSAIYNHIYFTQNIEGIEKIGANLGVATREKGFSQTDLEDLESLRIDISHLTPRFLNVGGRFEDLEKLKKLAKTRRWATMMILEYPAHSRYISPYVDLVRKDFEKATVSSPKIKMFSSLSARQISDPQEIKEEFLTCICRPIHWHRSLSSLVNDHQIKKFINIGPCSSLSKMMKDMNTSVPMEDAWNVLETEAPGIPSRYSGEPPST